MAPVNLSSGMVRSMTRGAPQRGAPEAGGPSADMTLLDRMNLLHIIAQDPPSGLGDLLEQIRQGHDGDTASVFHRLLAMAEGDLAALPGE